MLWEDQVLNDPDGVAVTAIFDDVHCADHRQQYEAVVGLYWLADRRPNRLEPFEDEVVGLLGALPDFTLSDDDDTSSSGTRGWAAEAVGLYTASQPRLVPVLFDSARNGQQRTRADARRALCYAVGTLEDAPEEAGAAPELAVRMYDHRSTISDWLHDESQPTTSTALRLLSGIAPWYCGTASEAVSVAVSQLDDSSTYTSAMGLLQSVARCNEQRRAEIVDQLLDELSTPDSATPERLAVALKHLAAIAEQHPRCRSRMTNFPRMLTDHDHLVVRIRAQTLDALLDRS